MNKKSHFKTIFGLVSVLLIALFLHYWFVYKDNLYIRLAFVDENKTAFPIDLIAKIRGRKIDTKLSDYLKESSSSDLDYREFFTELQNGNKRALTEYIDPGLRSKNPELVEQSVNELIESWGERSGATFEYILPGSKFSYLIHSILKDGEKIWLNYRFRIDGTRIYYLPFDNRSTLVNIIRNWLIAISEGWYGGIAPENKHYNAKRIGYIDYWIKLVPLTSQVTFSAEENNLTLYFNSYDFNEMSSTSAAKIEKLYSGFISAIEAKDIEALSNFVTKRSIGRLRPIFDPAYSSNYEQFLDSFNRVQPLSFVDADPLQVIYFKAPEGKYVEPMFVLEEAGVKKFSGIGLYSGSTDLFRAEELVNFMKQ